MPTRRLMLKAGLTALAIPVVARAQQLVWRQAPAVDHEVIVFVEQLRRVMRQMFRDPDEARVTLFDGAVLEAVVTDTQVLAPALRQAGVYTSPTFTIPSTIKFLFLFVNVDIADKLAVGNSLSLDVQHSPDGGVNWLPLVGIPNWTSYGPAGYHIIDKNGNPIDNPDPGCGLNPQAYLNDQFRMVMTLPQPLTFGATVEITT